MWLNSFLHDRTASCKLKHQEGEQFESHVGLPQGSVLLPLLFNIFTEDMSMVNENEIETFGDLAAATICAKNMRTQKISIRNVYKENAMRAAKKRMDDERGEYTKQHWKYNNINVKGRKERKLMLVKKKTATKGAVWLHPVYIHIYNTSSVLTGKSTS